MHCVCVVRSDWVIGGERTGRKFVSSGGSVSLWFKLLSVLPFFFFNLFFKMYNTMT